MHCIERSVIRVILGFAVAVGATVAEGAAAQAPMSTELSLKECPRLRRRASAYLEYGRLVEDSTTRDVSGTLIRLYPFARARRVVVMQAEGQLGGETPLLTSALNSHTGAVRFSFRSGNDTTGFVGSATCGHLVGTWRLSRSLSVRDTAQRSN